MKRLREYLLPAGWDASPSQGYPPALNSPVPIYTPGWSEEGTVRVKVHMNVVPRSTINTNGETEN